MGGSIFLMQTDGALLELNETAYDSEKVLQTLIAQYPNLMAGEQMNSGSPRRWLLISREFGVPDTLDGTNRWSLDHLFLDQEGIPTLVEVKRSTDTRIRREVVGQMLDYAANAVAFISVERIRALFEAQCNQDNATPEERLRPLLEISEEPEAFWQTVKTNLQVGRIRLLFVADTIPLELQRIIEFLNAQMSNTEVLGISISQYQGQGHSLYVPRLIGQTAASQQQRQVTERPSRQWNETTFFQEIESKGSNEDVRVAKVLLDWSKENADSVTWGKGAYWGSFIPMWNRDGTTYYPLAVYTTCKAEIQFYHLKTRPTFQEITLRTELLEKLKKIVEIDIRPERASFPFSRLANDYKMNEFLSYLKEIIAMLPECSAS